MNLRMFVVPLALLLPVTATIGRTAVTEPRSRANPGEATSTGAQLYVSTGCAQCHGLVGQGGNAGPRLAAKDYTLEFFTKRLRQPVEEMPPYTERVLNAAQVARLHAHVATLK
jgi:mono/diheme cytochrome c family protein